MLRETRRPCPGTGNDVILVNNTLSRGNLIIKHPFTTTTDMHKHAANYTAYMCLNYNLVILRVSRNTFSKSHHF